MSYTICSSCGQKALRVATRCPRCGLAFEEQFLSRARSTPKPRRAPLVLLIIGVVVALLGANALMRRLTIASQRSPPVAPPGSAVIPAPATDTRPTPRREIPSARIESPGPAPLPRVPVDSPASAPRIVELPAPAPVDRITTQRRYASTWMNVRAGRSKTAAVLRILSPGEAVQTDSLVRGWYRVVSDRLPPGYVDRRLLNDAHTPASP